MHCPCLSRPSLESDEIFLVVNTSQSLCKPWSTLSLFLWEVTDQTFGESQKKRKPSCQGGMENEISEWEAHLSTSAGGESTLTRPHGWHSFSLWALCVLCVPFAALTAPCLWLSLPEPVITRDQGKEPAHGCQRGWQCSVLQQPVLWKPCRRAPWQGHVSATSTGCPGARWPPPGKLEGALGKDGLELVLIECTWK